MNTQATKNRIATINGQRVLVLNGESDQQAAERYARIDAYQNDIIDDIPPSLEMDEEMTAIENIEMGDEVYIEFTMKASYNRRGVLVRDSYQTGKWTKATTSGILLIPADKWGPALYGFDTRNFSCRKASQGTLFKVRRSA